MVPAGTFGRARCQCRPTARHVAACNQLLAVHARPPPHAGVIYEGVIVTATLERVAHITPLGFRERDGEVELAPYLPSITQDNLRRHPYAVMNLCDDVRVIAGCLTGRRDWPLVRATTIPGWRLRDCLAHRELALSSIIEDDTRPRFRCRVVHEEIHGAFRGFNRAQAAVLEAAILVSRLDWLPPEQVRTDLRYLQTAIDKTAGEGEREAWQWLLSAIAAHPRHRAAGAARG